jgi:hypothetical protein
MKKRISQTYRILCSIYIFNTAIKSNVITKQLMIGNPNKDTEIIENIVKRMETLLKTPESKLTTQNEEIKPNGPND